ncbi:hypothetical protein JCM10908_000226 [Rhodotorula pacifica]|uniref:uncharacterized protein n=1 Tax=Rhodotorula pacifica TaxID=1495444 RepID=UPI00317001C1
MGQRSQRRRLLRRARIGQGAQDDTVSVEESVKNAVAAPATKPLPTRDHPFPPDVGVTVSLRSFMAASIRSASPPGLENVASDLYQEKRLNRQESHPASVPPSATAPPNRTPSSFSSLATAAPPPALESTDVEPVRAPLSQPGATAYFVAEGREHLLPHFERSPATANWIAQQAAESDAMVAADIAAFAESREQEVQRQGETVREAKGKGKARSGQQISGDAQLGASIESHVPVTAAAKQTAATTGTEADIPDAVLFDTFPPWNAALPGASEDLYMYYKSCQDDYRNGNVRPDDLENLRQLVRTLKAHESRAGSSDLTANPATSSNAAQNGSVVKARGSSNEKPISTARKSEAAPFQTGSALAKNNSSPSKKTQSAPKKPQSAPKKTTSSSIKPAPSTKPKAPSVKAPRNKPSTGSKDSTNKPKTKSRKIVSPSQIGDDTDADADAEVERSRRKRSIPDPAKIAAKKAKVLPQLDNEDEEATELFRKKPAAASFPGLPSDFRIPKKAQASTAEGAPAQNPTSLGAPTPTPV